MEESTSTVSFCPSFSCYSNESSKLADKLCEEAKSFDPGSDSDFEFFPAEGRSKEAVSPVVPVLPSLDGDVTKDQVSARVSTSRVASPARVLSSEERKRERGVEEFSSSESELDFEVEAIGRASWANHCTWRFNSSVLRSSPVPPSPAYCRKSNSTGSSSSPSKPKNFWNIKELLRRSRSDGGKDSYVLLTRSNTATESKKFGTGKAEAGPQTSPAKAKPKEKCSAQEAFYMKNKTLKENGKRRSFLPYKQDIVGFFYSRNGFSKTFTPF